MNFNPHFDLVGQHAYLSASNYHWTNYDDEKFVTTYRNNQAARRGDELHQLAFNMIRLGVRPTRSKATLNRYVNDAIGHRMTPEQVLWYSNNCFGTADAISFRNNLLRIHDLKTGITATSFRQLEVYVAYFCLEYNVDPAKIDILLRIYQNDEVKEYVPDLDDILHIMGQTIKFDKMIDQIRMEVLG